MNGLWVQIKNKNRAILRQKAFTLVEVAIAVTIAGIGLATLVVLQTRIINSYTYERNLMKAVLYAQYVMTFVEIDSKQADYGTEQGSLVSLLDQFGYFDTDNNAREERDFLKDWQYLKEIEKEDFGLWSILATLLPNFDQNMEIARKVRLTVSWGSASSQQYTLTFFTRIQNQQQQTQRL